MEAGAQPNARRSHRGQKDIAAGGGCHTPPGWGYREDSVDKSSVLNSPVPTARLQLVYNWSTIWYHYKLVYKLA